MKEVIFRVNSLDLQKFLCLEIYVSQQFDRFHQYILGKISESVPSFIRFVKVGGGREGGGGTEGR